MCCAVECQALECITWEKRLGESGDSTGAHMGLNKLGKPVLLPVIEWVFGRTSWCFLSIVARSMISFLCMPIARRERAGGAKLVCKSDKQARSADIVCTRVCICVRHTNFQNFKCLHVMQAGSALPAFTDHVRIDCGLYHCEQQMPLGSSTRQHRTVLGSTGQHQGSTRASQLFTQPFFTGNYSMSSLQVCEKRDTRKELLFPIMHLNFKTFPRKNAGLL